MPCSRQSSATTTPSSTWRKIARICIRTLIDEARLIPEAGQLRVELRGALAGILALSANNNTHLRRGADGSVSVLCEQIKLVAAARNRIPNTPHRPLVAGNASSIGLTYTLNS